MSHKKNKELALTVADELCGEYSAPVIQQIASSFSSEH